jgi:hypothetical protein
MTENAKIVFDTAFIVLRAEDGTWSVTTSMPAGSEVINNPSRTDVRIGCQEIANYISRTEYAETFLAALQTPVPQESSQTEAPVVSDDGSTGEPEQQG